MKTVFLQVRAPASAQRARGLASCWPPKDGDVLGRPGPKPRRPRPRLAQLQPLTDMGAGSKCSLSLATEMQGGLVRRILTGRPDGCRAPSSSSLPRVFKPAFSVGEVVLLFRKASLFLIKSFGFIN